MSAVYTTLAKEVLPELRRARFIANVEFTNYSSEELLQLIEENIDILDETALLRSATLVKKAADKEALYRKAIEKFNSNTAQYNLAVLLIKTNKLDQAAAELAKAEKDADWNNAMGVIALRNGNRVEAANYFKAAANDAANQNLGLLDILAGDYKAAAAQLAGVQSFNANLVKVLNGDYSIADNGHQCKCGKSAYLKAVAAARMGKAEEVKANLEIASKNPKLAERAAKDIEFAQYR